MNKYATFDNVIKDENFTVNEEEITCEICMNLKNNPMMCTTCQCSVCDICAKSLKECPFERKKNEWVPCRSVKRILSKLNFKCNICQIHINYDGVESHYMTHDSNIPPIQNYYELYNKEKEKNQKLTKENNYLKFKLDNNGVNESENYEKDNLIKTLRIRIEKLEDENDNLKEKIEENERLQKKIDKLNQNVANLQDECENKAEIIKQLEHKNNNINNNRNQKVIPNIINSLYHGHPLIENANTSISQCNKCNITVPIYSSFCCPVCNFVVCNNCRQNEVFYVINNS